ncbi:hypothetical protein DPEC_G00223530 [Dallia pectoralis]|uniref:Uncharacterized protein n=1 Tax=Dallia pectoralis TaxID=75939 RepID=A0ACC2FZZ9_DALPE|nr:hypothetical protein DPEC_G00223530 [Dallia pectoralis]
MVSGKTVKPIHSPRSDSTEKNIENILGDIKVAIIQQDVLMHLVGLLAIGRFTPSSTQPTPPRVMGRGHCLLGSQSYDSLTAINQICLEFPPGKDSTFVSQAKAVPSGTAHPWQG